MPFVARSDELVSTHCLSPSIVREYHAPLNPLDPDMLALKLTLVPLFLLVVSMSGKWWGPSVAGWLAGLPVVAGPILFLLVLAHGPAFGAHAAQRSLSAVLASEAFNFAYAWTCRSRSWPLALAAALLAWFVVACGLSCLPTSALWAGIAALAAVCFGQSFLPRSASIAPAASLSRADLIGRMTAGAVLTLLVRVGAGRLEVSRRYQDGQAPPGLGCSPCSRCWGSFFRCLLTARTGRNLSYRCFGGWCLADSRLPRSA